MKKFLLLLAILPFMISCNGQDKIDLKDIINKEHNNVFSKNEIEFTEEPKEIVTKLPSYAFYDQQIENFKFGEITFEKNENTYVKILVDSFSKSQILAFMIDEKNNPNLAEKLNTYLLKQFGAPVIIEPQPTLKSNNIILGNSASKWTDSKNNTSIYFYKNYIKSDGKQIIGFSLHIISNNAEYSTELSAELQTKKIIDWYNTRF